MKSRFDAGGRPRLLLIGHGGHGKDTAAALLAGELGLSWASSSEFAAQRAIWPLVAGRGLWPDWRAAYADRRAHRAFWFHAIRAYNLAPGPSLAEQLLAEHEIYVGMRSREELTQTRHLFECVIWLDAGDRVPPEDAGSIELGPGDADFILDNAGTPTDLGRAVARLADALREALIPAA